MFTGNVLTCFWVYKGNNHKNEENHDEEVDAVQCSLDGCYDSL